MSLASNLAALARLLTAAAGGIVKGTTPPAGDNTKALATTEWFKAEQATETVQGTATVATQEITNAGTDDAAIVTPKKMRAGFSASLSGNGYIAFPTWLGGLIIQWGSLNQSGSNQVSVTFPIAFPNALLSCGATSTNSTASNNGASTFATSKVSMGVSLNAPYSFTWYSIGR